MNKKVLYVLLFFLSIQQQSTDAQVRLPRLVRDSMILQRDVKIKLWGWASNGEKISIKFNKKNYKTKADANGNWSIFLSPLKAGGALYDGHRRQKQISLKEILIGDVWFCSGQSIWYIK
jgi:sialate O-acetylesterase